MFNYYNSIQYVNGIDSARAYQTQPNQSVILMDSNEDKFYLVRADASNFKTVDEYAFTKIEPKVTTYVTHEEFDELKKTIESLKGAYHEQHDE